MFTIRITICVQLGCLVFLATSIGLTVVALATWYTNHRFVRDVRSDALLLSASLKSAQLASALLLMQTFTRQVTLRRSPQRALEMYYKSSHNPRDEWERTAEDYDAMFAGNETNRIAVQARIYHREDSNRLLFSRTASSVANVTLPYETPDKQPAQMEDDLHGYTPELYPQFNVHAINPKLDQYRADYEGRSIDLNIPLLSGPYKVNDHLSMLSITMPIVNITSSTRVMGWLTLALDARLIIDVLESREGLGQGGVSLLVGPCNVTNKFPVGYVFDTENWEEHKGASQSGTAPPYDWERYPTIRDGFTTATGNRNNAGSALSITNEDLHDVSVGYAIVNSSIVDWMVVLERPQAKIWAPILRLRKVILSCILGTMAAMLAITFPAAHYLSKPVRRLRDATRTAVSLQTPREGSLSKQSDVENDASNSVASNRKSFAIQITRYRKVHVSRCEQEHTANERRQFIIPSKVQEGRHIIRDELTETTKTFNGMVDELRTQYKELENRVQQRTAELELSKDAAEAANKSKTQFIANISHELKTPLNGIMGMLSVCLPEEGSPKLKHSLELIYKSAGLLSNLLTNRLTFRENELGQHSCLDEKEFRLRDIGSQVLSIFGQQAEEGGSTLSVKFEGSCGANMDNEGQTANEGNATSFRPESLEDVLFYGDEHLILRVILNLVSNSLKFTTAGGSVALTIRCTRELNEADDERAPPKKPILNPSPWAVLSANESKSIQTGMAHVNMASFPKKASEAKPSPPILSCYRSPKSSSEQWFSLDFAVEDTGLGIPEHLHSKIFEPFVQVDLNLTKKYSGTGLGLSICSRLASMLKSTIRMTSQVGQGSVFVMSIPLRRITSVDGGKESSIPDPIMSKLSSYDTSTNEIHLISASRTPRLKRTRPFTLNPRGETDSSTITLQANQKPHQVLQYKAPYTATSPSDLTQVQEFSKEREVDEAKGFQGKAKVLIVEDNKTNQEVITRMLQLESLRDVMVACDGREAVDKVRESAQHHCQYNLILMDVQMPILDGVQATRLIRQSGFSAPIVALTAYTDQANMKECLDAGMDAFLSNPIRRSALRDVLQVHLLHNDPSNHEASTSPISD